MVRTFANLPADDIRSFSYYHVLSRDAFSEPQHYNGKVHSRLTSAKGHLSKVQGFAQVLVH